MFVLAQIKENIKASRHWPLGGGGGGGIHRWPVNSPHKGPVTWKMFPFDDVIIYLLSKSQKAFVAKLLEKIDRVIPAQHTQIILFGRHGVNSWINMNRQIYKILQIIWEHSWNILLIWLVCCFRGIFGDYRPSIKHEVFIRGIGSLHQMIFSTVIFSRRETPFPFMWYILFRN